MIFCRKLYFLPTNFHDCEEQHSGMVGATSYWSAEQLSRYLVLLLILAAAATKDITKSRIYSRGIEDKVRVRTDAQHHDWPPMRYHNIWNEVEKKQAAENLFNASKLVVANNYKNDYGFLQNSLYGSDVAIKSKTNSIIKFRNIIEISGHHRASKVLHIFPLPVDGECLSDDGRRTGTCQNAYECRKKGGQAKGNCAMGFGVCCIFVANCNETISNNITYIVSPNFPSSMSHNFNACSFKIKMISDDISQLRIDFHHFSLGQPNRRTGVCDGDVFNISGGLGGTFTLCGQNSGQHIYYDVGGHAIPRQAIYANLRPLSLQQVYPNLNIGNYTIQKQVEITMNFTHRILPIRLWEIRIAQIPFSQRAPAGCLQYYTGNEGIIQTFNYGENGRHLANQNYRICIRQEVNMCSIIYQPCDEQSFRIGASSPNRVFGGDINMEVDTTEVMGMLGPSGVIMRPVKVPSDTSGGTMLIMNQSSIMDQATELTFTTEVTNITSTTEAITITNTTAEAMQTPNNTIDGTDTTSTTTVSSEVPSTEASSSSATESTTTVTEAASSSSMTPLSDDLEEGSGNEGFDPSPPLRPSRRPRPTSGGFDLITFLRSAFDFGLRHQKKARQLKRTTMERERQFFNTCNDRITMPCIVEDFIGMGLGELPGCEPIHCGSEFCSTGAWPCRVESTVTPFYIGVHFGDGSGKGSPEDNIGACLRYGQVQCI